MKPAAPTETIAVHALRVGMFVHLDGGWMSHPFPLSSFRISSPGQIATIRSLGLASVRWSPQQSDPAAPVDAPAARAANDSQLSEDDAETAVAPRAGEAGDGADGAAASAATAAATPEPAADDAPAAEAPSAPGDDADRGPDTVPDRLAGPAGDDAATRAQRRRRLAEQRAAVELVMRQYGEAAQACRRTFEKAASRPREARAEADALTSALVTKMIGSGELCVRMLGEGIGDRASMHAMNVAVISLLMGRCFGYDDHELHGLGVGAMLHDIGKLELPPSLRWRDDHFSPGEARAYEEHVELGVALGKRMGLPEDALAIVAQHHESADGNGFPARLNNDRMTMGARIVAIVNRYDNLCNPRLPARALTPHEALQVLFAQGRSRYDTSVLAAFIRMMGVYPPGSLVQLTDDRYAQVVSTNASRPLRPDVLVHDAAVPREEAIVVDLQRCASLGIRRSVKLQQLPPTVVDYLQPTARVAYFFEPAEAIDLADAA